MLHIHLLRHGKTQGNLERRYIGTTDEPLCRQGRRESAQKAVDLAAVCSRTAAVYCSPLKRCLETAAILFPRQQPIIIDDLRESDFGRFENKNYQELQDDPDYQAWLDSAGQLPFPGGESSDAVQERVLAALDQVIGQAQVNDYKDITLVVHGGTIMTIMAARVRPQKSFYEWQPQNTCGYTVSVDPAKWLKGKHLYLETTL